MAWIPVLKLNFTAPPYASQAFVGMSDVIKIDFFYNEICADD